MTNASTEKTTASPAQIWAVLSDGHRYDQWVQGTKEIRERRQRLAQPGRLYPLHRGAWVPSPTRMRR
ncbi:MAG: hypothetical protein WKF82_08310 [Nocardioidaceae bacterium]